ncbi:response regulator [Aliterella atlantica]|uniref:Chemotaxis protein CheY n=1 Tax=Aliterella atlantica CENA595 TaxID=1618023 RepID=A0A0D8ZVX3_9CYAN|nr:response regulator [Aliterella atlantica]KJH71371.1 chemotaxis protein CheY [Aliterella atlantica CENA595]
MSQTEYQARQLASIIEELQSKQTTGILYVDTNINLQPKKRSRVLVLRQGQIVYGGTTLPNNQEFAQELGRKLNHEWTDSAIGLATQKAANSTSLRSLLDLLVKMRLFNWEQIQALMHAQAVLALEQILPHAGSYRLDNAIDFDLTYGEPARGLDQSKLMHEIAQRQKQWATFVPTIPSMDAVPYLQPNNANKITNPAVRKHLEQWADGKRSLVDIAEGLNKDPLQIAQSYLPWVQAGWVAIAGSNAPAPKKELPVVLAVDDSPVMQVMLKRALSEQYQVLIASNAKDALMLLHRSEIALLLLDVTMPDIDGLEVCRTVRTIPKFRNLPIVMVTARDGFFDKVKGKFAGSTEYITKPFEADKLCQLVGKYVYGEDTSTSLSST